MRLPLVSYRYLLVLFLITTLIGESRLLAQREFPYTLRQAEASPLWVTQMYEKDADPGEVMKLYDEYYKVNPFVKNQHTQYYKRWLSGLSKNVVPDPINDPIYLQQTAEAKQHRSVANWSTVGPIDWDHSAAGR